jgi:hypothetical protein
MVTVVTAIPHFSTGAAVGSSAVSVHFVKLIFTAMQVQAKNF